MITLTQLEYVVAVDEFRHFATAADKCFVTQPTLSMQIKKLEDDLGVIIFDRSRQPVVPTDIGYKLIEQARIVLASTQRIKEIINEVNRIGININQIVFNNNAGLYSKEDKTQLVAYMRKLNKKVNEAVVQIGNQ